VDRVVRGAVDLDEVGAAAGADLAARRAGAARLGRGALLAVEGAGERPGGGGLPDPARAGEQEGVVDATAGDGVAQRAGDVLLPHDLVEGRRAVLPCDGEVRHLLLLGRRATARSNAPGP